MQRFSKELGVQLLTGLILLSCCLLSTSSLASSDLVKFSVAERLQFAAPSEWHVLTSKSNETNTVFAFQILNAADDGTGDSTNLAIVTSYLNSRQDKDNFENDASTQEHRGQKKELVTGWRCDSFNARQQSTSTEYSIWDCYRVIADNGVHVRLAWPHLSKNPPDYDEQMETTLTAFLTSVVPYKKLSN